jgi:hypothetical protein
MVFRFGKNGPGRDDGTHTQFDYMFAFRCTYSQNRKVFKNIAHDAASFLVMVFDIQYSGCGRVVCRDGIFFDDLAREITPPCFL